MRTGYAQLPLHNGRAPAWPFSRMVLLAFPVDRETYDRTIRVLHRALDRAKIDRSGKVRALRRLARFELVP